MDLSASSLFASFLVGMVGLGLFIYGKKQTRLPQLVVGMALMVFPYFVESVLLVYAVSVALLLGLWGAVQWGW
jgi:hypothetical protein